MTTTGPDREAAGRHLVLSGTVVPSSDDLAVCIARVHAAQRGEVALSRLDSQDLRRVLNVRRTGCDRGTS